MIFNLAVLDYLDLLHLYIYIYIYRQDRLE